jgi:hypothetical protein
MGRPERASDIHPSGVQYLRHCGGGQGRRRAFPRFGSGHTRPSRERSNTDSCQFRPDAEKSGLAPT